MRDRDALLTELGSQIHALIVESRAFATQAAEGLQPAVSGSAFAALQWMHAFGPDKASRIADGLAMDRSVVSRLMKPLVQMALVEAQPDELDGRVVRYGLSARGRARVASAIANKDNAYRKRLQGWSDEDLVTLAELLRRLVNDRGDAEPATRDRQPTPGPIRT